MFRLIIFALIALVVFATPIFAQVDSVGVELIADSADTQLRTVEPFADEKVVAEITSMPKDSLTWQERHSPKKASILSALVPGAGQIYNRKYWKAPIVWAGLGVSAYFIAENTKQYRRYKDAYIAIVDNDPTTIDEFNGSVSAGQVLNVVDTYRRWRDLSYIAIGAVYALNIIDASVDAHFVRFDVSPDLSMELGPSLPALSQGAVGVSVGFAFR
ncbi:MAG: DUF5683 domain-containing protein [Flavobacteriales bacterium]|nr:hypothetical protein [Flavobacteriales bacterium]